MNKQDEKKHPHKPDPDDMPHYSLPIDKVIFDKLFHEAYAEVCTDFLDEVKLKDRIKRDVEDTVIDVLKNHVHKITSRHLNRE